MGFMDEMMAAKRTADSHANLKATEAIAEAQDRQAYAAEVQAEQNQMHNERMLSLAIDEKLDKLDGQLMKDTLFHYEQLLGIIQEPKSKILQRHIFNGFWQGAKTFFGEATSQLTEIGDKREAETLRKKWTNLATELEAVQADYEKSSLCHGGVCENKLSAEQKALNSEKGKNSGMAEILAKESAKSFRHKIWLIRELAVKGDVFSAYAEQDIGKKKIPQWQQLSRLTDEADLTAARDVEKAKKNVPLYWFGLLSAIGLLIPSSLLIRSYPVLGIIALCMNVAGLAFCAMGIFRQETSYIAAQKAFRANQEASILTKLEIEYEPLRKRVDAAQAEMDTCYQQIKADFPDFEKYQSQAISVHQDFIKACQEKQAEIKQKMRNARR